MLELLIVYFAIGLWRFVYYLWSNIVSNYTTLYNIKYKEKHGPARYVFMQIFSYAVIFVLEVFAWPYVIMRQKIHNDK